MAGRRRVRLSEGIYQDAYGLAAVVKLGGVQREQRFPPGTDLAILESWRIQKRAELDEDKQRVPSVPRGALQKDGDRWITRKQGLACYKADRSHLRAWYPALGLTLRSAITREHIERLVAGWRTSGVAVRTIRHRVRVLRELYHGLDGSSAWTPVDEISLGTPPRPEPRAVPLKTIQKVAAGLKAMAKTLAARGKANPKAAIQHERRRQSLLRHYARFLVRATTGQRPALIGRAQPSDVDLTRRIWFVRSGKGGYAVPLPLNAEMVQAWRFFARVKAWGPFDTSNAAKRLRTYGWPTDIRPYDLRHTFAIDHLMLGTDLGDVQGLLGHTQIQTTRTHYAPVLTARLKHVTAKRRLKLTP